MNIMASRIYRNVNSGVFQIRQLQVNGPSTIADIKLNGHRMGEINLNRAGIGSGVSGGTTVFELQKENGSLDFIGENRV